MAARTNSSIISDQAKALSAGITTQRDGLTRINNALDNATISTAPTCATLPRGEAVEIGL